MRRTLLPLVGSLAMLQAIGPPLTVTQAVLRLIADAGALAGFSFVFRAGAPWRDSSTDHLADSIKEFGAIMSSSLERIEQHFHGMHHLVTDIAEAREANDDAADLGAVVRRQRRLEQRVERLEAEAERARLAQ